MIDFEKIAARIMTAAKKAKVRFGKQKALYWGDIIYREIEGKMEFTGKPAADFADYLTRKIDDLIHAKRMGRIS